MLHYKAFLSGEYFRSIEPGGNFVVFDCDCILINWYWD